MVCKLSPPSPIPINKYWDTNLCQLVCKDSQPAFIPSNKYWSTTNCALTCKNSPPLTIPTNFKWDTNTCSLVCENDMSGVPKAGYTWNSNTCTYELDVCTLKDSDCKAPHRVNDKCACACPINMQEPTGYDSTIKYWDTNECVLKCKNDRSKTIKDGYTWNPDICDFYCTRQCSNNYAIDAASCQCVCGITNSDCPGIQTVNSACECACPNNMNPPSTFDELTFYWNSEECVLQCIAPEPNPLTPGKRWDDTTCTEVCINVLKCPGNQRFMTDKCECRCESPIPSNIPDYKYWDDVQCAVVCSHTKPLVCPYDNQEWDENLCKCTCPNEATTNCDVGSFFSQKLGCKCVPPCLIPPPANGCEANMHWCQETCQCECKDEVIPYGYQCDNPLKTFDNTTCACGCKEIIECAQPDFFYFESETCGCECYEPEPQGGCAAQNSKYIWYPNLCDCLCNNHDTDRKACTNPQSNKKWNANTCACECKNAPVCNPTLHNTNLDNCSCDCKVEPTPCPSPDYAWDRLECKCVFCDVCRSNGATFIN